jgi:RNA polymerase sigma-70 factor (ECF subfamily)
MSEMAEAALRRHRAQVFRYLRRRTGSDELADDLTQDVFLTAAARLAQLESAEPPLAWLYTVAKSRLIDEARRVRRRPQVVPLELASTVADLGYPQELASALRSAALRLPPGDRELIGRRLFEERSFAELAVKLGTSEAAVKMRYLRALRALRVELEKEGIEP